MTVPACVAHDDPDLVAGLAAWADTRWFEAHERLEARWRRTPPGPDRHALQALIQCAVSLEHARRGRPRAARGQWTKARAHLARVPGRVSWAGLDLLALEADFDGFWRGLGLDAAVEAEDAGRPWGLPAGCRVPLPRPATAPSS